MLQTEHCLIRCWFDYPSLRVLGCGFILLGVMSSPALGKPSQALLNSKLLTAVRAKNSITVETLLREGADVNVVAEEDTPLNLAIQKGDESLVRLLVARGADVNLKNAINNPPLYFAIDKPQIVGLLLDHGANPNSDFAWAFEDSVFMEAATAGELETARLMLAKGAKVNFVGRYGQSALDHAVDRRNLPMIRLLKSHGARLGAMFSTGSSPSIARLIRREHLQYTPIKELHAWYDAQYRH